jgi:hypothetical protein
VTEPDDFNVECIDFVKHAVRAILQSSASIEEARVRVEKLAVHAYALPLTKHRTIVVLAGEPED